jgi:adenylate cyclase class 2
MAKEIEAKLKVPDLAPIRSRLKEAGALRKKAELETNTFFDTKDQFLLKSDSGLRIRIARDESGKQTYKVTMKGRRESGRFKRREETEFIADEPDAVKAIFERMGYSVALSFQKRRETWELQSCEVALDDLPHLGTFVEIEGKSDSAIANVQKLLGLEGAEPIQTAYADMIAKYIDEHAIKSRAVNF